MPEPLIFVVHRVRGELSPALYHDDRLPPRCDPVVYQQRIDTLPNAAELMAAPPGELMRGLFRRYLDLIELGAVPRGVT